MNAGDLLKPIINQSVKQTIETNTQLWTNPVAVLGWGQGATGPPNLAQATQIFDWFPDALFLLEGF